MKLLSRNKSLSLVALLFCGVSFGQINYLPKTSQDAPPSIVYKSYPNEDGIHRCHTMEMDSIRRANDPSLPSLYQDELWLQRKIAEFKAKRAEDVAKGLPKQVVITIPVVVHVIHNGDAVGTGENISDCQVESQITVMNQDFRRMMGTNGYNTHPDGADVEIEFCLASVDPSGNPTNGIDRVNLGQASFDMGQVDSNVKPSTIWDPTQYMNMWCVRFSSGGLLGYAQFPSNSGLPGLNANEGPANTDGVVSGYQYFGSQSICPSGTYAPTFNLGRTMTHEVGHWLGLRHIWGDGGCSASDYCADTPESDNPNYGCPTTHVSCGTTDMVQNYMDYTDDACMNIFTQDQKDRMLTVMSVSPRRASLVTSNVCASPVADDAGISAINDPNGSICAASVVPEVVLTNFGSNNLTSVTIMYNVDGGASSSQPWSGNLAPGATTVVTLPVISPSAGPHTFNVYTTNPNGTTDGNTSNDANLSNFTLNPAGQEVTISLTTDCYAEELVWELFDSGANLVASGGNETVTTPVTAQQNTATSDPGAYPNNTTINEVLCLATDCYDFYIWDAYGDGMAMAQSGCPSNGSYQILDAGMNVLATMQTANAAYGFGEANDFCLSSPCSATFTTPQTQTESCYGDNTNQITVNFTTGNQSGATYDIGSGASGSNVFSGLAQGNYTITVVDGDACTTYLPVTVTGPSQINVSTSSSNISCNGQTDGSITVNANGGSAPYTYTVGGNSSGSATFSGLGVNTYTVSVTDNNGCVVNGSNVSITQPSVLTSSVGTISPELGGNDGSVDLNVSGGTGPYSYAWTGPGGYTSGVQDPNNMPGGTYDVTITDANGCTTSQTGIQVPSQLGIDEFGNLIFSIYPNPSNGLFNVTIANPSDEADIQVMDMTGRIIYAQNKVNGKVAVDLTNVASGHYVMAVSLNGAVHVRKLTLNK